MLRRRLPSVLPLLFASVLASACGESHVPGDGAPPPEVDGAAPTLDAGGAPVDASTPVDASAPVDAAAPVDATAVECGTPGATETVACGNCGTRERVCGASGVWVEGVCAAEGECAPGDERAGPCGSCGTRSERCTPECAWEPLDACAGEGECAPGTRARSADGCPDGQEREIVCGDACSFEPAGACEGMACPSPGTLERVPCGTMCGTTERFCTAAGMWSYGACEGEGVCVPGTSDSLDCGMCGSRTARCTSACAWDTSGACTGEGTCAPGATTRTTAGCPAGQSRLLTCSAACAYEPGLCEPDDCTPGATETVACGMCGTRTRTCSASRTWQDGPCMGEGVCAAGSSGSETCGTCGTQATRCSATCQWEPDGGCAGELSCAPPPSRCVDSMTLRTFSSTPMCSTRMCSTSSTDVSCTGGCSAGMCAGPVGLLDGFGGPAGFGTNDLPPNDDTSSAAIPLASAFPSGLHYYGTTHTALFVNNNGNVSFGARLATYSPRFPGASQPMIAPWWGDVDTRGDGRPAQNNVYWHFDGARLIVTWHLVGYYATHDTLQNSFQVILTDRSDVAPGDFDVELRYAQCEWTTGDASGGTDGLGGTPANAGFDAGNMTDYLALPGSGTAAVLDLCTTSNVGAPGLWRYQVRGGIPR